MGNNPGKQQASDNFEREGYLSSPRSNSIKLMDDDEQIQGYRTPKASKRAQSTVRNQDQQLVTKPDFQYNDAAENKKRSKNRGRRFFCGGRESMIDNNGNVKSNAIKKGGLQPKHKKKVKQNGVILGRATEGDNRTEDSSVYTENLDVNMTQTFSTAYNGKNTMVSQQKGQSLRQDYLRNLGVPSDGKSRDSNIPQVVIYNGRQTNLFGTIQSNIPDSSNSPSLLPQDPTQPTTSPEEEDKPDIEEAKVQHPKRRDFDEDEDDDQEDQSLTNFAQENQIPKPNQKVGVVEQFNTFSMQKQLEPRTPTIKQQKRSIMAKHLKKQKPNMGRSNSVTDVERDTLINRVEPNELQPPIVDYNPIGAMYDQTKSQNVMNQSLKNSFDMVFSNSIKLSEGEQPQDFLHVSNKNNIFTQKELVEKFNIRKRGESLQQSNISGSLSRFNSQFKTPQIAQRGTSIHSTNSNQEWRSSLLSRLTYEKIWLTPETKPKTHQTIIIFDWDDTLIPTSFLIPYQQLIYQPLSKPLPATIGKKMAEIDEYAARLLEMSKQSGKTLIITNAAEGWVELSAQRFMPLTAKVLRKDVEIISARTRFEKELPRQYQEWKIRAFLQCTEKLEMQAVTNLVALGDNVFEIEAAHKLYQQFQSAFIKTIKFRSAPTTGELTKQIKLVLEQFDHICHSPKNLTVRLHRIENENDKKLPKTPQVQTKQKRQQSMPHHQTLQASQSSQGSYTGTGDHTSQLINKLKQQQQIKNQKAKEKKQK